MKKIFWAMLLLVSTHASARELTIVYSLDCWLWERGDFNQVVETPVQTFTGGFNQPVRIHGQPYFLSAGYDGATGTIDLNGLLEGRTGSYRTDSEVELNKNFSLTATNFAGQEFGVRCRAF